MQKTDWSILIICRTTNNITQVNSLSMAINSSFDQHLLHSVGQLILTSEAKLLSLYSGCLLDWRNLLGPGEYHSLVC